MPRPAEHAQLEFVWKNVADLQESPDAKVPIDVEDAEAIGASIREIGVLSPLLITKDNFVVDGVTRLRQAKAAGLEQVPCLIVAGDPRHIVCESLIRRPTTTAQRVLIFLESHWPQVQSAAQANGDPRNTGRGRSAGKAVSGETAFSAGAISDRLKVCKEDVLAGIDMLEAIEYTLRPPGSTIRTQDEINAAKAGLTAHRQHILSGHPTSLRRWRAALGGRAATKAKDRTGPQYHLIFERACTSLDNVFEHWQDVQAFAKANPDWYSRTLGKWDEAATQLPEALLPGIEQRVLPETKRDLKALIARLRKALKTAE